MAAGQPLDLGLRELQVEQMADDFAIAVDRAR